MTDAARNYIRGPISGGSVPENTRSGSVSPYSVYLRHASPFTLSWRIHLPNHVCGFKCSMNRALVPEDTGDLSVHTAYWAIQAGLLTPLTFARYRLSPLAAFTSGVYFLHNGRR